jgi:hypothetical protein
MAQVNNNRNQVKAIVKTIVVKAYVRAQGQAGPAGPQGNPGEAGVGFPTGGTTGQVLAKNSSTNYDASFKTLTKSDVGLSNVDNTSDTSKPISSATQTALNAKYDASNPAGYVNSAQAASVGPVQSVAGKTGVVTLVKGDVGLGNVDNTSDANKPVSTATQTALNTKGQVDTIVAGTNITVNNADPKNPIISSTGGGGSVSDATTTTKGIIQLAGDLAGTAASPTVPGLAGKQATLVSGTNIKTINGVSILGSGDLPVSGSGGGSGTVTNVSSSSSDLTITNPTTTPVLTVVSSPKLTTARNINGVAFDGTSNITVTDATKEPVISTGTTAQYYRGDKTFQTLNQDAVPDGTTNKAYTSTEKTKLAGIATNANVGVVPNANITASTKTKITYDAKGLVTAGVDATTADIADSTNKRYVTDAQATVISNTSGTNTGDQDLSPYATTSSVNASLATKVQQSTSTNTAEVYSRLNGSETTTLYSSLAGNNTLARRTASGQLTANDATVDTNVTTRGQVNTALALKQDIISLTTVGTSGAATLVGSTLNIPQYSGGGGGGSGITRSIAAITASMTGGSSSLVDYIYYWNDAVAYTFTLPTASGNTNRYTLKNTGTITQAVAGSTDISTIKPGDAYEFFSDGTTWRAI